MSNRIKYCFVLDKDKGLVTLQWSEHKTSFLEVSIPLVSRTIKDKKVFPKQVQSERVLSTKTIFKKDEKYYKGWGPAPNDRIYIEDDSEKKGFSAGKISIFSESDISKNEAESKFEKKRAAPPIMKTKGSSSGIFFKSSSMGVRSQIVKGCSRKVHNSIGIKEGNTSIELVDNASYGRIFY